MAPSLENAQRVLLERTMHNCLPSKKQGQHRGTIGTHSVMIARCRHQLQAPQISTANPSMIKLPGTVGPTVPCRYTGWSSNIGRREISGGPCSSTCCPSRSMRPHVEGINQMQIPRLRFPNVTIFSSFSTSTSTPPRTRQNQQSYPPCLESRLLEAWA
jgi:hypothetical protein